MADKPKAEYCTDDNCKFNHCRWGVEGSKRLHIDDCGLRHCYNCLSHKLNIDEKGCVLSWYCNKCQQEREGEPQHPLTLQQKILSLKNKYPKDEQLVKDLEFQREAEEVFLGSNK